MSKRLAVGLLAIVVLLGVVIVKRHDLLRWAIQTSAGLASGYTVRIGDQIVGPDQMVLSDVHVSHGKYPLLDAGKLEVHYSLRDMLPGSTRRFGLASVEITDAKVTLVKFKDGTYNIIIPQPGPPQIPPALPQPVDRVPIRFWLKMHNAELELREPEAYDETAKDIIVQNFNVDATIDTATVTRYRSGGSFHEPIRNMPFTIDGTIDAVRSFAMHRMRAPRFPLRSLANYFADTPVVRILHGGARNFDARLYSLDVRPNEPPNYHANLELDVDGGVIAMSALAKPAENIHGHLQLVDNAFFLRHIHGTLAGIPLHMTGGIFDLTGELTGAAQLRLGIYGGGDLKDLRTAFAVTKDQPISGGIDLGVLVEGPIDNPLIVAQGKALKAIYRNLPFNALTAGVVYHDNLVALLPLHAYYGGTEVGIRGTLAIGKKLHEIVGVHIVGNANRLPYLDEMLGNEQMLVDASAVGDDLNFRVRGALASAGGISRVAALLDLDPNGTGFVRPFWLHTERGNLDGGYYLDRPHDTSGIWMLGSNLRMHVPAYKAFPGLDLPQMPKVNGTDVNFTMAGGGSGHDVEIGGVATAAHTDIEGVKFDRIAASFAGTMDKAEINLLHATGPWGRFDGVGAFGSAAFVARGNYSGTFEGLQPFLGDAIPGHGAVAGLASIAVEPKGIVVQGIDLHMRNATLRGVPVSRASLTLAVQGNNLRVYSAHAKAAGGDIVAAGTFSVAPPGEPHAPGTLSLVANELDAGQLKGIGLPLDAGTLSASGNLSAGAPIPDFDGAVTIARGRVQNFAISGGGDVHMHGDQADLQKVIGAIGTTYAHVDGTIGELSSGKPAYSLDAYVPAGGMASALHSLGFPNYMTDGSFNARLRVGGRGVTPTVAGPIAVPAGSVNGLPFLDANALLAADTSGVSMSEGNVLVGTTKAQFAAVQRPAESEVHVVAPRADLADFNNFFDTGDTLAGKGSVRIAAGFSGKRISSSGNVDVAGFRYRSFPIGDTRATWSSANDKISGAVAVGGDHGLLKAHGSIGFFPSHDVRDMVTRSRYDLTGDVSNLDLSLWIAALGFPQVPITGRASGEATIHGVYPLLNLRANAQIAGGTLGPLSLDTATVAMHSTGGTLVTIDQAAMVTPGLQATATGTMGFRPTDPLAVQLHASTDDVARLVYQFSRVKVPVQGTFESTLQIGGTIKSPTFVAGLDANDVIAYGIPIASLFGSVRLHGNNLVLSNAGATFAKGEAALAGSLPLQLSPLRIASANSPVSFDLGVTDLDPGIFAAMLGTNAKVGGAINGHIGLSGTIGQPVVVGQASLANGSYTSDLERTPIDQAAATLIFNRTSMEIQRLSARVGTGSVQGSGRVEFPHGFASPSGYAFSGNLVANGAQLDSPTYGSGTIDAAVAFTKPSTKNAVVSGKVALSNATLPFAAFLNAAQGGGPSFGPSLPPIGFDLQMTATKNVRVRGSGYGAGLDISGTGSVKLAGTLAAPTLDGSFNSAGGTLTYFDRAFRVAEGSVAFDPADGIKPTIHAVGTTTVVNPDPDRARNPYGSADINIKVDGPIDSLKIAFTSNPPGYSNEQILGMIAPFGGFVNGIGFNNASPYQVQSPGGITPLGAVQPIPGLYTLQRNGTITVGQEAFNILNAQFTAGLLSPVETQLSQGLGLSSVNLTLGYYGNVGFKATRLLGKSVSAVYAVTFGIPQVQSFGLQVQPSAYTSANLNFFYESGPTRVLETPGSPLGINQGYLLGQPLLGTSGFSLTFQRDI